MRPTPEIIDSLYRERVLRARTIPIGEKLLSGAELFEDVCERMAAGLRSENPEADEAQIRTLLRERLDRVRRLRDADVGK